IILEHFTPLEPECAPGTYGPDCSKTCSANCYGPDNACSPSNGYCRNGCEVGYQGDTCDQKCRNGKFGRDCSEDCNINCGGSDNACDHVNGECSNGCDNGYLGVTCMTECLAGTYGPSCREMCSTNCAGGHTACNHIDGTCTSGCNVGYQGYKCDTECHSGKYGDRCSESCNQNCKGWDNSCHHITGTCTNGCDDGYQGDMCNFECSPGTYGAGCRQTCNVNCKSNSCDHVTGNCDRGCNDGYRGAMCDQKCSAGYYGPDCRLNCPSNCNERSCNHIDGSCTKGCNTGYQGNICADKCGLGTYGDGCQERCSVNCAGEGDPCHHIYGYCDQDCDPGYEWRKCTKECRAGRYGNKCYGYCSKNCAGPDHMCNHVNGTCNEGCTTGYTGHNCKEECPVGYYGDGCKQSCSEHCAGDKNPCHHITGRCDQGCDSGYRGESCTEECQTGTYGSRCSRTCSEFCSGQDHACHHVYGTCDVCSKGYRGQRCEQECEMGQFGEGCRENCSDHCAGDGSPCHHVTGTCDEGCQPGYYDSLCVEECNSTKFGQDCALTCSSRCLDNECDHVTGICLECPHGYWGDLCEQVCNASMFGAGCNKTCSAHCLNQKCHHVTGECALCVESRTGAFCETLQQPRSGGDGGGSTIGAVIGVLLVILIIVAVLAGVYYFRYRRKRPDKEPVQEDGIGLERRIETTPQIHSSSTTESNSNGSKPPKSLKTRRTMSAKRKNGVDDESEEDMGNEVAETAAPPLLTGNTALPVETLKAYILHHAADSHFKDEFASVPMTNSTPTTCALLAENIKKNRYKNILPYDANRVLLGVVAGKKTSDFINASYVKDHRNDVTFIASQGPNDVILHDFVRMLWEQRVDRVVMLTNLVEMGKKKCSMYWPVDGEEEFGEVTIKLLTTHVFAEYTIRHLRLSKSGESSRNLTQFHFTAWPDKSIPESPWGLVDLHQRVMSVPGSGPILVHCSAGVGRTGTFIGLCNLLQEAEATGKMDFLSTLWKLRQDRMHTIQTVAQYAFLHKVALVGHMTAGTTFKVKDMYANLDILEGGTRGNRSARSYRQEFQTLLDVCEATTVKPSEGPPAEEQEESVYQNTSGAASGPLNKGKDRLSNILPNPAYRPLLTAEIHQEDTYINAVLVPNLTRNSHDVLTQLPLPSTVTDFWRLVTQYDVGLVVAFDTESRDHDETIAEFFPTGECEAFENDRFTVETKPPTVGRMATELFLTVHQKVLPGMDSSNTQKKRTLTLLLCKNTKLDPEAVLELQESIKFRKPGGKSRTIYMCRNGADQCGLMCVQSILMERMEVDQCLTVPLVVGTIKAIRPQVIPTLDQYKCLYRVLKLAHDSQNVYGNVGDMPRIM
ncbi:hypothetical protein EGW08_018943, partial [Elysia chlorotica]